MFAGEGVPAAVWLLFLIAPLVGGAIAVVIWKITRPAEVFSAMRDQERSSAKSGVTTEAAGVHGFRPPRACSSREASSP